MDPLDIFKKYNSTLYRISPKIRNKILDTILFKEKDDVDYKNPKIKKIELRITERCNLRCPMCWWWGTNGIGFLDTKSHSSRIYAELTTEEIRSIIDQVAKYSPTINFIGGEIFLREDTVDLIKYATKHIKSVSLVTNGTLLNSSMCAELSQLKNMEITFSLDGTESAHDKIRGGGSYRKTIESIENIINFRNESKKPLVAANTTITPYGIDDLPNLIEELELLGIDIIKVQHLWFTNRYAADKHISEVKRRLNIDDRGAESYIMDPPSLENIQSMANIINQIERKRHKIPVLIKPRLTKKEIIQYYTDLRFRKRDHCNVAFDSLIIESDGNVVFCPDEWISGFKLGNIRANTIDEIWNGEKANFFRATLREDGLFPGCSRCCVLNL